jgi:zinc protease
MRLPLVASLIALPIACNKTPPASPAATAQAPALVTTLPAAAATEGATLGDVELPSVPPAATGAAGIGSPSPMPAVPAFELPASAPRTEEAPAMAPAAETPSPAPAAAAKTSSTAPASTAAVTPPAAYPVPTIPAAYLMLKNGLRVVLIPDDTLPQVHVHVAYAVGARDEEPGKTGVTRLVESLMYQGSQHAPGPILPRFEKAGANLAARGADGRSDEDRTVFFTSVPATSLENVLWLESDRMGFLGEALDPKVFEQQREALLDERRQLEERHFGAQPAVVARYLYPDGHPYAHTPEGRDSDVRSLTLEDAKAWHRRWFTPSNAVLTISGQIDVTAAKALVAKYFGDLPPGTARTRSALVAARLPADVLVQRREPAPQPKVALFWHSPALFDDDEAALTLAAQTLAEGAASRLTRRLVYEKKLATRVAAYQASRELTGVFAIEALGVDETALPAIEQEVAAALAALAKDGPTSAELDGGKAAFELRLMNDLERANGLGGKADRLSRYAMLLGNPRALEPDVARHMTVTRTEVAAAVGRWLAGKPHLTVRFLRESGQAVATEGLDRSAEPGLAGQLTFQVPGFTSKTLDNGMTLHVVSRPGLPKVETALIIKGGDLSESEANAGLSFLTAAAVDRATRTRSHADIEAQLALLGAVLTTEGSKFGSAASLSVLKRHLDAATELLADVVRNPSFPEGDVTALRELRLAQVKQEKATPLTLAAELLPRILFAGGHAAGVPDRGVEASMSKLQASDLAAHHAAYWVPNNAAWLVIGDVTLEEAEKLAVKHFGAWKPRQLPTAAPEAGGSPGRNYVFLVDAPDSREVQVRIGAVAPNRAGPEHHALQIASHVLGGSYASRIVTELRKARVYASNVYSQLIQNQLFGYWLTAATVGQGDVAATLTALRKAVEGLSAAGPDGKAASFTEDEVAEARRVLSRNYLAGFETQAQILRQAAPAIAEGRDASALTQYVKLLFAETPETVGAAAQKHFAPGKSIALVVGDLKQIESTVAALRWGETIVLSPEGRLLRRVEAPAVADTSAVPNGGAGTPPPGDMAPGVVAPGPVADHVPTPAGHDEHGHPHDMPGETPPVATPASVAP